MTACVDNKTKKGGAAKAVSATLAGVLAVGMVPAAAFAETAGDTESADVVEMLTANNATAWIQGSITGATDNSGASIADLENITLSAGGYVIPTEYTPKESDPVDLPVTNTQGSVQGAVAYFSVTVDSSGNETLNRVATGAWTVGEDGAVSYSVYKGSSTNGAAYTFMPGTYAVKVSNNTLGVSTTAVTNYLKFTVESADLSTASIYEVQTGEEADSVSDTTFEWNGEEWAFGNTYSAGQNTLNLVLDGKPLEEGKDYTVTVYQNNLPVAEVTNAGDYVAVITGADDSKYDGQKVEIEFTIGKLDLSKAEFTVAMSGVDGYKKLPAEIKAGSVTIWKTTETTVDLVSVAANQQMTGAYGSYSFTITPNADNEESSNLTGTGKATVVNAAQVATIQYDGENWGDNSANAQWSGEADANDYSVFNVNHSDDGNKDFDISKIAATQEYANKSLAIDVTVKDADGNIVDNSSVTKPGTWYVEATVDSAACAYQYKGTAKAKVVVTEGSVDSGTNVYVKYDGELLSGTKSETYTGEDFAKAIDVVVTDAEGKELTEGTDYTVEITKGGKAVTEMVDAGIYTIEVKSGAYEISGDNEVTFEIEAVGANELRFDPATTADDYYKTGTEDTKTYLVYTGSEITPSIQYKTGQKDDEGEDIYAELPIAAYNVTYKMLNEKTGKYSVVDGIVEPGTYKVEISDVTGDEPAAINYTVASKTFDVVVEDGNIFTDVPNDAWYTKDIYQAQKLNYITGYAGTTMFGPNNNIIRADAVVILSRMAGIDATINGNNPFTDVSYSEETAYYYAPIVWAANTNIVKGYDGTSLFMPSNNVTREEFCVMLYNYAKATYQVGDKTEADLAVFPDASSVDTWATEAVEWAVANDLFGSSGVLNPQGAITRAEACKMVVAFQPDGSLNKDEAATN